MNHIIKTIRKVYNGRLQFLNDTVTIENLATNKDYCFVGCRYDTDEILRETAQLVSTYGLYVTNERDNFSLNVRDYLDNVVLEGDDLRSFIEDGYIRCASDVYNLNKYLSKHLDLPLMEMEIKFIS